MADLVVVQTATVTFTASSPLTVTIPTHSLSVAASGPFLLSESKEVLLESDLDASFKSYTTNYVTVSHTIPGLLMYQTIKSISGLSELVNKNDEAIVTLATEGTITCQVTLPAQQPSTPSPIPDNTPTYDIDFSISVAGQTVTQSD